MTQPCRPLRRDAARNHDRIVAAAREVFGEAGADACMEQIAERAGVGVGTVYRRFANKDALIDELLRLALDDVLDATDAALARTDGRGLEELLRALGRLVRRPRPLRRPAARPPHRRAGQPPDPVGDRRAGGPRDPCGTADPAVTAGDVMAVVWAMRGLVQATHAVAPDAWQRFLDIHLAGLRAAGLGSTAAPMTARQLARLR